MSEAETLRDLAIEIVSAVGAEAADRRESGFSWSTKSTGTDVVTEIDTWAEAEVVRLIDLTRDTDGILGEEGTSREGTTGVTWVIDPIDGTTNLLYDLPGYSVSVGVERDGQVIAGAVYDCIRGEVFAAAHGCGSTRDGERISPTPITDLSTALVATGFSYRSEQREAQATQLKTILPAIRDIRRNGGAALDLCAVACGRADASYERGLSPWDSSAGSLIAAEAGAVVERGPLTRAAAPGIAEAFFALLDRADA